LATRAALAFVEEEDDSALRRDVVPPGVVPTRFNPRPDALERFLGPTSRPVRPLLPCAPPSSASSGRPSSARL
jgi:hypothetical protein